MYTHQGPVLSVCWNKVRLSHSGMLGGLLDMRLAVQDGTKILSGGADNAARMFDVTTGVSTQVALHDAPIKCVRWIESPQGGVLVTGSWDKTVKVSGTAPCAVARSDDHP